ncbi:MAG: T9SS type A sorting domain-containing protein [Saprospiraceae bacterium]
MYNFNFSFEAIERTTGDTVVIFYDEDTKIYKEFRDQAGYPVKIVQESEEFAISGSETIDFVGAKYNADVQTWGPVGVYQATLNSLTQVYELGTRPKYDLNFVYKDYIFYQYIIDHDSSSSTKVLAYNTATHTFDNVSSSVLPGFEVLEAYNLQTIYNDGETSGMNSFHESVWKCKNLAFGNVRYFLRSPYRDDKEIIDLRNKENAFFIFDEGIEDTLYYYSYGENQRGLVRYNIVNNIAAKDPSSIPFDTDFKIRGWKGKMYFGRYDSASGKIAAAYKDFYEDGKYAFLQSNTGEKIVNPIDFTFYHDDVFVHSRTNEGVKLVYYDTATIVSTDEIQEAINSVEINPNPSTGIITLKFSDIGETTTVFTKYSICNSMGKIIGHGNIYSSDIEINLSEKPAGVYFLILKRDQEILLTKQFVLIE